ncbi:hypothetical protein AtubIFM55763_010816 [Aspergillus tubingensis]|nr:hypothetical protein AtubIFM55763_010816 [Aspergillus tubingensis]GLB18867.1 hypothetical protein AtubIFM61612_008764 [Aspergillus tubingensis]
MHALGLDDCLVLLALVCTIFTEDEDDPTLNRTEQSMVLVFAALSIILTTYGIGYHQDTVPTADMIMMEKCWPVQAVWDSTIPNSKCFSNAVLEDLQLYQAILMLLFDVSIITLPMPTIWKLQMPIQRRLFIIGLFCLDVGAVPLILMNVEYALGLITGSLPSLRVLLRNIPGLNSSKKSTDPSRDWRNGPGHSGYQLSERSHWAHKFKGKGKLDLESCDNESQQRIVVTTTVEQE